MAWARTRICGSTKRACRRPGSPPLQSYVPRCGRLPPTFASSANGRSPRSGGATRVGVSLGQLVRPLESVGCYVPGGRYPLVSTLLMTVIPAQVAGVKNIRVVSPQPGAKYWLRQGCSACGSFTGRRRAGDCRAGVRIRTISRADKIVGPGNLYVTAAKKLVSFDCAIDFLAGPTEVVILSDGGTPEFIAADLVAQAEHDPEAMAVSITTSRRLAKSVAAGVRTCRWTIQSLGNRCAGTARF